MLLLLLFIVDEIPNESLESYLNNIMKLSERPAREIKEVQTSCRNS
jgi:hypothetical protein